MLMALLALLLLAGALPSLAAPPPEVRNIAPLADISTSPWLGTFDFVGRYVDGDLAVSHSFRGGLPVPGSIRLEWDRPYALHSIRFTLPIDADGKVQPVRYTIVGDAEGDGDFEATLVPVVTNTEADEAKGAERVSVAYAGETRHLRWFEHALDGRKLRAIQLRALEAPKGYLASGPAVSEIEIYTEDPIPAVAPAPALPRPEPWSVSLRLEPSDAPAPLASGRRVHKSVFVEGGATPWNVSLREEIAAGSIDRIGASAAFRRLTERLRALGVHELHCLNPMMDGKAVWPHSSFYRDSVAEDLLGPFVRAMHEAGFEVGASSYAEWPWFPASRGRWTWPREEYDRHPPVTPLYPCVISDAFYRKGRAMVNRGMIGTGDAALDSLYVIGDEYYYKSHPLPVPADDPCRVKFLQRFGHAPPEAAANTQAYRDWVRFCFEGVADNIQHLSQQAKLADPELTTVAGLCIDYLVFNNRIQHGISVDVIARRAPDLDFVELNPYPEMHGQMKHNWVTLTAKYGAAAAPGGRLGMVLQGARIAGQIRPRLFRPVDVYGGMLSAFIHGARYLSMYRLDYLTKTFDDVALGFRTIAALERAGFTEARPVKTVALCVSRASADWWWAAEEDPTRKCRGSASDEMMTDFLLRHGYPFDIFFLDYPEELTELERYQLIVLPFPYALSRDAARRIIDAAKAGARVLVMQTAGAVDQDGKPHEADGGALQPCLELPTCCFWPEIDLLTDGTRRSFLRGLKSEIDASLAPGTPFALDAGGACGADVETTMLVHPAGRIFIPVLNWEKRPVPVGLDLNLRDGRLRQVRVLTPSGWRQQNQPLPARNRIGLRLGENEFAVLVLDQADGER